MLQATAIATPVLLDSVVVKLVLRAIMDLNVPILANVKTMGSAIQQQVPATACLAGSERIAASHVLQKHLASFANRIVVV